MDEVGRISSINGATSSDDLSADMFAGTGSQSTFGLGLHVDALRYGNNASLELALANFEHDSAKKVIDDLT